MDSEAFYDLLNMMPVKDCIEYMKLNCYDIAMDAQPDMILLRFHTITNEEDAEALAAIFLELIGNVVICREYSYRQKQFYTIMDELLDVPEPLAIGKQLLIEAFGRAGFKCAHECCSRELASLYSMDDEYLIMIDKINIDYDYDSIKTIHDPITESLSEYLFNPVRIQKWIETGREIETYMS